MSILKPFRSIRYRGGEDGDVSNLLAPPYDVLDAADKARLLARDPRNFVGADLPHVPPKAAGPAAAYEAAARQMSQWLADGTMIRDEKPALYVYHQHYSHGGHDYVRKLFFARLKLEPFGSGSVFPHEQTFGGPKEDRLCLTKATRANMSPIFGLYPDAENAVSRHLDRAISGEPLLRGRLDDTDNRLWAVTDEATIKQVVEMMRERPTFIADGHHRYGTAMLYREWLVEQQGPLPEEHPANYVLCAFCAMEDPGLLILPTHRVLPGVAVEPGLLRNDTKVEIAHLLVDSPEQAPSALAKFGPQALALFSGKENSYFMLRPRQPNLLDSIAPDRSPAWRGLALAFLHAYLLDRVVTPQVLGGKPPEVHYVKAAEPAVAEARESSGSAFLLQATTMKEMADVCLAGDLMPQKSTYFYPKLASGLVVNPLED